VPNNKTVQKKVIHLEKLIFIPMKLHKKILILLICCLPLFATVNAQENSTKKQKKIARLKEEKDQEALTKYQKALKQHHKNQSKDTRKQMKQSLKQSKKSTPGYHKTFFVKRWFKHKK
jgi:hypothetical protein